MEFGFNTKLEVGQIVAIYAEGKDNALAIGVMEMHQDEIIEVNHGNAVKIYTYITDGLWKLDLTQ